MEWLKSYLTTEPCYLYRDVFLPQILVVDVTRENSLSPLDQNVGQAEKSTVTFLATPFLFS